MKKGLTISLLTVLALCSCQKETDDPIDPKTFIGTIEAVTKTSIDDQGNALWKKGNQVSIFEESSINQKYQVTDASDGKNEAVLESVTSTNYVAGNDLNNIVAFYPYSSTAAIAKNEGAYVISGIALPQTQNYAEGTFGDNAFPMAAVTASVTEQNLQFKNILGCLQLQLKGTASIKSISVTGNSDEILCGAASITATTENVPSINLTDTESKTVTLDCGTGVQLNTETTTSFVIALPPMTLTEGITVVITDTENGHMEVKIAESQTITRSSILKMPVMDYDGTDYFTITSTGSTSISIEKEGEPHPITLEYKKGTDDWSAYTSGTGIELNDGESLQFRAGESGNETFSIDNENYYKFVPNGSGTMNVSGNIISLLDRSLERTTMPAWGFFRLFDNCTKLVDASKLKLPATVLEKNCYNQMFTGCSSLTEAPELPATTLANYCYSRMFEGTALTKAPALPATTLAKSCYGRMFYKCASLTEAPELPATTLNEDCYYYMFGYCSSLTEAPELPATTLAKSCYENMFEGTALTKTPELKATTLANGCYANMFYQCTSLTQVPDELPATTLMPSCYEAMFSNCTALTKAPKLPSTTLAEYCYENMFSNCTSLTEAPELPATTLVSNCYEGMFESCTSLTKAPELKATTLVNACYGFMFNGCTKLNYVKALFTTEPTENYTLNWLSEVASNGTFVKSKDATWNVTGPNGVPEGWNIETETE